MKKFAAIKTKRKLKTSNKKHKLHKKLQNGRKKILLLHKVKFTAL